MIDVTKAVSSQRLTFREAKELFDPNVKKTCSRCSRTLSIAHFGLSKRSKDGFYSTCRGCLQKKYAAYYQQHKDKLKPLGTESGRKYKLQNNLTILSYKRSHPCVDCGNSTVEVLDFDHRDGTEKKFNISEAGPSSSPRRLAAEIAKCDIRCANCHRKRTYGNLTWRTEDPKDLSHLSRIARNTALTRRRRKEKVREYCCDGCVDCGEKDFRVLELDHVRGEKLDNVSDIIRQGVSEEKFLTELTKCDPRCANCHRKVTSARRQQAAS